MLESYPDPWWQTIIYLDYGWPALERYKESNSIDDLNIAISWFSKSLEYAWKYGFSEEIVIGSWDIGAASGVLIRRLLNEVKMPGEYEVEIDVSDLPAGVYFCTLKTDEGII